MAQDKGQALGWDDEGQVQDSQFEVLPAGEYDYEVVRFTRERFDGSDKMGPCPVAVLQLRCTNAQATGTVFVRLYLNSKVLWRITAFFKSAGLVPVDAPEGASMPMSLFEQATGCTGRCKLKVTKRTYNGTEYENNEADFVVPKGGQAAPPPAQQRSWGGQGF